MNKRTHLPLGFFFFCHDPQDLRYAQLLQWIKGHFHSEQNWTELPEL